MKQLLGILGLAFVFSASKAQTNLTNTYTAYLVRQDNNTVVFNIEVAKENNAIVFYIINADEKIRVAPITVAGDSVNFSMPTFESTFKTKLNADGSLQGTWIKGTSGDFQHWQFYAVPNQNFRFAKNQGGAKYNIGGKWDVTISRPNGTPRKALAEFEQDGDRLTGSFLTPSGDYRFLEGVVTGDSLKLSTFDGAQAYTFYARIADDDKIVGGVYLSGYNGKETWSAKKDNSV